MQLTHRFDTISELKNIISSNMDRKDFLKLSLGLVMISPLKACLKDEEGGTIVNESGSTNGSSAANCVVTNSETAGPFPTKNPSGFVIKDIKSDRSGVPLLVNLTIKNKNKDCTALQGAQVDIWHCDADGNYSEYGSLTSAHFLRGRQATDTNGIASYQSIFPGWYSGRAVHIHVHVFDASGKSLLVTQIAFPAVVCNTVFTTSTNFYKNGKADTANESDGIFRDGYANEICSIEGSVAAGYTLSHTIVVSA